MMEEMDQQMEEDQPYEFYDENGQPQKFVD